MLYSVTVEALAFSLYSRGTALFVDNSRVTVSCET